MPLPPSTHLGPYEITATLGVGGMGEVYRARDKRLGREVAVKILPASFAEDADRLRRFEQEARAVAALNHPNILAIHDLGKTDGTHYLVTELLEGESLHARLRSGPMPLRKALEIAIQAAHGVAAAHDRGIVHRDLKPANLFVTEDGRVKILDFGLAKLVSQADANQSDSLTLTQAADAATEPGLVLGTAGYMSPEQVRGKVADSRSDIFSLGAILYEMLSGKRAFQKDSPAETMSAILNEEPAELAGEGTKISPSVDRVVRHCLEKGPAERFQSARDLAFDLESLSNLSASTSIAAVRDHRHTWPRWISIAGLSGLAAFAVGLGIGQRRPPDPGPVWQRLTFGKGSVLSARFAPDGQTVFYSAAWNGRPSEIFATRPESPESRSVGVREAELLSISRKGEMLAITGIKPFGPSGEGYIGTLARIPLEGGAPREVASFVQSAEWSSDSENLAVTREGNGSRVLEYPVGHVLYQSGGFILKPRLSPQGDRIAFFDISRLADNSVVLIDLAGRAKVISSGWKDLTGLAWTPDGKEIWFTGSRTNGSASLISVTREGRERIVHQFPGELNLFDLSKDGKALLGIQSWRSEILARLADEKQDRDLSWFDYSILDWVSPNGRTLLFHEAGEAGGPSAAAYVRLTDGSAPVRLSQGQCLTVSPDGNLAVCATASGAGPLVLTPTRTGTPKILPDDHLVHQWIDWFPDGRRLLIVGNEAGHGRKAYVLDLATSVPRAISQEGTYFAALSRDGANIAVMSETEGLTIYPVNGPPRRVPGTTTEDMFAGWGMDGRSVFVAQGGKLPTPIFRFDLATGKRELWKELSPPDAAGVRNLSPVFISADEKTLVYNVERRLVDLFVVQGLH